MKPCIPDTTFEGRIKLMFNFQFGTGNFGTTDVFETVNTIGRMEIFENTENGRFIRFGIKIY